MPDTVYVCVRARARVCACARACVPVCGVRTWICVLLSSSQATQYGLSPFLELSDYEAPADMYNCTQADPELNATHLVLRIAPRCLSFLSPSHNNQIRVRVHPGYFTNHNGVYCSRSVWVRACFEAGVRVRAVPSPWCARVPCRRL
jgi:hypothetical protein